MRIALAAAAILWPLLLGTAVLAQRDRPDRPLWVGALYLGASHICHQRPERSFFTAGIQWPVCGRCSGLYLGAPIGAVAAWRKRRGQRRPRISLRSTVLLAALPSLATLALEWSGLMPVSNLARLLAAVPLGAAIACALIRVAGPRSSMEYTGSR